MTALTDADEDRFQQMVAACVGGAMGSLELSVVRSQLDGRDVAVVVVIEDVDGDNVRITPVAVLIDDDTFDRLRDPLDLLDEQETAAAV